MDMQPLITELHGLLPASFADLQQDFACGVVGADGRHILLDQGSLAPAVTASAAIPVVFSPVEVPGQWCPLCACQAAHACCLLLRGLV